MGKYALRHPVTYKVNITNNAPPQTEYTTQTTLRHMQNTHYKRHAASYKICMTNDTSLRTKYTLQTTPRYKIHRTNEIEYQWNKIPTGKISIK